MKKNSFQRQTFQCIFNLVLYRIIQSKLLSKIKVSKRSFNLQKKKIPKFYQPLLKIVIKFRKMFLNSPSDYISNNEGSINLPAPVTLNQYKKIQKFII